MSLIARIAGGNEGLFRMKFRSYKFYFSISKQEQQRRFKDIKNSPLKRWKMTPVDENAQKLWDKYTSYKKLMFKKTHTELAPWVIIKADKKTSARIEATEHILKTIPYGDVSRE